MCCSAKPVLVLETTLSPSCLCVCARVCVCVGSVPLLREDDCSPIIVAMYGGVDSACVCTGYVNSARRARVFA